MYTLFDEMKLRLGFVENKKKEQNDDAISSADR